jgi:hypothetical protein
MNWTDAARESFVFGKKIRPRGASRFHTVEHWIAVHDRDAPTYENIGWEVEGVVEPSHWMKGTVFDRIFPSPKPDLSPKPDMVNTPPHYNSHPSGVECIQVTEHLNFCLGNAVKYIWRAGLKGEALEDLKKAEFYLKREIARIEKDEE